MFLQKIRTCGRPLHAGPCLAGAALALPLPWQMDFQPAASPGDGAHRGSSTPLLLVHHHADLRVRPRRCLLWIIIRYNHARQSGAQQGQRTTRCSKWLWTIVPVIILVVDRDSRRSSCSISKPKFRRPI